MKRFIIKLKTKDYYHNSFQSGIKQSKIARSQRLNQCTVGALSGKEQAQRREEEKTQHSK